MEQKPSYYSILPANVRYDNELRANEKILYSEITALSNKNGECTASNNYFSKLYSVEPSAITKWIKHLEEKNYIEVEYQYRENTKEIEKRIIKIIGSHKCEYVVTKKGEGYSQKDKENNTSINNINNIYRHFENVFVRTINCIEAQMIENWMKDKTENEIINAIDESAKHNIDNFKYIEKILYSKTKPIKKTPEWFNQEIPDGEIEQDDDFKKFIEEFRNEKN